MSKVVIESLYKTYENGFPAVINANFVAEQGEFIVLVGPSGCGKSTTLRMIAGLESISQGSIYIDDQRINDVSPKDRDLAMVFQNYALYPHLSVFDNMAFALKIKKIPLKDIKNKVGEVAKMLGIDQILNHKPKELSGGQRQRVALGRAIVRNPKVFLFDEPLSNLDARMRVQMRTEISKLHYSLRSTMIYVTHDQVEAMTMGSKIIVMKDGVIQQIDTPLNIYNQPCNKFVAGFIGSPSMNFILGEIVHINGKLFFHNNYLQIPFTDKLESNLRDYHRKQIIFGVRPEDIYDARYKNLAENPVDFDTICELVEPLGNEFMVYTKASDDLITARIFPKIKPDVGKPFKMSLDWNKVHFFDVETERIICPS